MESTDFRFIKARIGIAMNNKMPIESRYIFVGEIFGMMSIRAITQEEYDELLSDLGFKKNDLFQFTDYVAFGNIVEDED